LVPDGLAEASEISRGREQAGVRRDAVEAERVLVMDLAAHETAAVLVVELGRCGAMDVDAVPERVVHGLSETQRAGDVGFDECVEALPGSGLGERHGGHESNAGVREAGTRRRLQRYLEQRRDPVVTVAGDLPQPRDRR